LQTALLLAHEVRGLSRASLPSDTAELARYLIGKPLCAKPGETGLAVVLARQRLIHRAIVVGTEALEAPNTTIVQTQYSGRPRLRNRLAPRNPSGRCTNSWRNIEPPVHGSLIGGGKTSADQATLFNSGLVRYVDLMDSYMAPADCATRVTTLGPY